MSEQERHLSVGNSLLGQVVEDDDSVHSIVTEVFSHGNSRVGSKILQRGSIGSSGRNNSGVFHGISICEPLDNLGNSGSLLSNSNVNAVKFLLGITSFVEPLLVDDGVNSNSSFSSLSVSNDQLTLSTANWHKGVDSLDTSLHRLADGLSWDDTRGLKTNSELLLCSQGTLAINWVSKSIDNTSKNFHANGNIHNSTGSLDNITFLDKFVITKDDNTNVVWLQVKSHALQSGAEFHHFLCLDILKAIDTSNTVSNGQDTASFFEVDSRSSSKNSLFQDRGDLTRSSLGSIELAVC